MAARRRSHEKDIDLLHYKGELLSRVELSANNQLASVTVPWKEIEEYSPRYNPTMLAIDDMRLITGVRIAIGYKVYNTDRITAKIRCNYGYPIAAKLAEKFGGGGHEYAAGFKILDGTSIDDIKSQVNEIATQLLEEVHE